MTTSFQDVEAMSGSGVEGFGVEEGGGVSTAGVPVEEAGSRLTTSRFTATGTSIEPKRTRVDSVALVDVDGCGASGSGQEAGNIPKSGQIRVVRPWLKTALSG